MGGPAAAMSKCEHAAYGVTRVMAFHRFVFSLLACGLSTLACCRLVWSAYAYCRSPQQGIPRQQQLQTGRSNSSWCLQRSGDVKMTWFFNTTPRPAMLPPESSRKRPLTDSAFIMPIFNLAYRFCFSNGAKTGGMDAWPGVRPVWTFQFCLLQHDGMHRCLGRPTRSDSDSNVSGYSVHLTVERLRIRTAAVP